MVSSIAILTLLTVAASCLGFSPLVRHESRRALPPNWERSRRAPADMILPFRVGLTQPNLDRIGELLLDVSHPESRNYGNHWSAAEVANTFRPSPETVHNVRSWLMKEGIDASRIQLSTSGGWIEANISVAEAEKLLNTEYFVYSHVSADVEHIGCASGYHVPANIAKDIELITPTVHFDAVVGERTAELRRRDSHPGKHTSGPVSPVSVGIIKVSSLYLLVCQSCCFELSFVHRRSSTSWRIVTSISLRTVFAHCMTSLSSHVQQKRIASASVRCFCFVASIRCFYTLKITILVEYTPNAYLASDLDLFFRNFSKSQIGERPVLTSIDGGMR